VKNWNSRKKKRKEGQIVPSFFAWLKWAEGVAYGPLALKPKEFYELTPMELVKAC
jgi:hypothetical protein